ncbi:MAG: trypsin-like serine protease [Clostridia bacterium]|nr:trypsin-like serine protease [Clostridia bacterium]
MLNKGMTLLLALVLCFTLMAGAQAAVSFEIDTQTQTENHAENTEAEVPVQVAGSMGTNEKAAADGDWGLSLDLDEEEDIPDEIKGIFGTDDRVMLNRMQRESWPNCAVTYLKLKFPSGATGHGTGFMIGPSYVLTCGHCVYDEQQGGWATEITVAPGSNGSKKPYGETTAIWLACMDEWYYYEESCYDLGMIKTADPIGNKCGWLGYYCPGDYELNGYAKIVGYGEGTTVMYESKGYLNGT